MKSQKKPQFYEYNSRIELIEDLKEQRQKFEGAGKLEYELDEVARNSVGPNTFRAFRKNNGRQPSEVFRAWASTTVKDGRFLDALAGIQDEEKFDEWHDKLCNSFSEYWKASMGYKIKFGPSRKLPDLFLRVLVFNRDLLPKEIKDRLMKFLHVPLDRFVLKAIKNVVDLKKLKVGKLTMSGIESQNQYDQIQKELRNIAKESMAPPIYLDVLAWDKMH